MIGLPTNDILTLDEVAEILNISLPTVNLQTAEEFHTSLMVVNDLFITI